MNPAMNTFQTRWLLGALAAVLAVTMIAATQAPADKASSTTEGLARLEQGFTALDANKDGQVDRKEFARIIDLSAKLKANPDWVDLLFGRLDRNEDGKLTIEEYKGI